MGLAEVRENIHHESPDADEESNDEQECSPFRHRCAPEESPVTTVRTTQPIITKNLRCKEPEHKFTTEERFEEIRNLRRNLAVIFWKAVQQQVRKEETGYRQWP